MYDIIFIGSKYSNQWKILKNKFVNAKQADNFESAKKKALTKFFWIVPDDVVINSDFYFDYIPDEWSNNYVHVFKNNKYYDGIYLVNKKNPPSEREINYRFFVNRKEVDIIASRPIEYEKLYVDNYNDLQTQLADVRSSFVWVITKNLDVNFDFKYQIPYWDKEIVYIFKNKNFYDGIILLHKDTNISSKEFDYKSFTKRHEVDIIASKPTPYDIVFISYNEPNADENYNALRKRFPKAKRIHGIKGIHQAHIEAAKICNSDMFWIVDGDAQIVDGFNFDHQIPQYDTNAKNTVYVWRSINPINDLVYGYGGIKLLPRKLTINMDTSKPDMTTSISSKFKAVNEISNITAFNTDPFNTWKSAFRECAKLSSKIIDRQKNEETQKRLETWCTVGEDRPYGSYALAGARAGREFGISNSSNLQLINDFDWLKEQFDVTT